MAAQGAAAEGLGSMRCRCGAAKAEQYLLCRECHGLERLREEVRRILREERLAEERRARYYVSERAFKARLFGGG